MESVLSFPTQIPHGLRLLLLAGREFLADLGRQGVVLGALDQEPPLVAVAATGDAAEALARAAGVLHADQAEVGHELAGMSEAVDIAQFADGDHCGDELEAAEGHEGLDSGFEAPGLQEREHGGFDTLNALVAGVNALEIFLEDRFHGWVWEDQFPEVTHMGLAPVGLALIAVAVA